MSDLNLDIPDFNPRGRLHLPRLHQVLHRTPRQTNAPVSHATGG